MDGSVATASKTDGKQPENKRAKFVALAESRTVNAIRAIRVIGKLGNKSAYEYDDADVKKIIAALSREVDALKARLGQKSNKGQVEFKL